MTEERRTSTKTLVLVATAICLFAGGLAAYSVGSEPIAYIASMSHGMIVLFLLIPAVLILICLGIAGLALQKMRFAIVFFVSSVVLPASYFVVVLGAQALGIARYQTSGLNEMRPIGSELQHRIVVVFKKEAPEDEINQFDENILRKKVPQPNGVLLEFADGICNFSYPQRPDVTIVDVPFCVDATEEQKQGIRDQIISSPLVHTAYEDVGPDEVRKLK